MLSNIVITEVIHEAILSIWNEEIPKDYKNIWLLKEDTLKNALYFHLRSRLGWLFEENDIRIFTEFTDGKFKCSGYRPDMVIAKVNMDKTTGYWGDATTECLAVIELKFKHGFAGNETVYADYDKLRHYIESLGINGQLYMATIWEYEDDPVAWIRKNAAWAKGKVTELNASYKRNSESELQFYVFEHK